MATAEKTEVVKFVSKGQNFRAILLNPVTSPHPVSGERVVVQQGFTAEFSRKPFEPVQGDSDGSFQWPPLSTDPYAEHVREDGIYVDPVSGAEVDVVAKLRSHPDINVQFVELGPDPAELKAQENELLGEVSRCIATRDIDRLAEIFDAEEAGDRRESILTASLEGLRAVESAIEAEREPEVG